MDPVDSSRTDQPQFIDGRGQCLSRRQKIDLSLLWPSCGGLSTDHSLPLNQPFPSCGTDQRLRKPAPAETLPVLFTTVAHFFVETALRETVGASELPVPRPIEPSLLSLDTL